MTHVFILLSYLAAALHSLFVVYVLFGGFLGLRWRNNPLIHLPAVAWAVLIELTGLWGLGCPLTGLQKHFILLGGAVPYPGEFLNYYVKPYIFPGAIYRYSGIISALLVIGFNAVAYGLIIRRRCRSS